MPAIDTLIKYINSDNVAEFLNEEEQRKLVDKVVLGYEIDDDSRQQWLKVNQEALKLIKYSDETEPDKEFPFYKASKAVYPLITPAVIQLASRLIQHIVRNDKVLECKVIGEDQVITDPNTGQSTGMGVKETAAKKLSDDASYELLVKSDTWLPDQHKLCHMLAAWGMAFKELYYNSERQETCFELVSPDDIVINKNETSLEKCRRITRRIYLTKNDIVEKQRSGQFLEFDLDKLKTSMVDNKNKENDSREESPIYEILRQFCYIDLDDDGYEEPYCVYVHKHSRTLLGIYPEFRLEDIKITDRGTIRSIKPCINIIDYHLIDDPEGGFYSLGLNHILLNPNKSIISTLRMLLDSGILSNTQGGFVTKAFKTKERSLRFKLGEFKVIDTPSNVDLRQQIMPLPFKEPSQVLLALLQVLIDNGKETGLITDILTGDTQMQNVPATTSLAMVEQATRAFKPVVQKFYHSEKKEFKVWFRIKAQYEEGFDNEEYEICPVADPTMSSEAHKYARLQAMINYVQTVPEASNLPEVTKIFYRGLEFPTPERMAAPPVQPAPDPKLLDIQLKDKIATKEAELKELKILLDAREVDLKEREVKVKEHDSGFKSKESEIKTAKTIVDAHKDAANLKLQKQRTDIDAYSAETERERIRILEKQPRSPRNT